MKIGPYEVLGELGRGGMGTVYRVRSPGGGEAALKVLIKVDAAARARFERERRLLASFGEEQGFVGFLDSGSFSDGPWLLMPLVRGGTLREKLGAGPLGVEETVALGVQLATALGTAHERGIVHRDVKPENVLFTRDGRPLLADLGLAKHFDRGAPGASQSVSLSAHDAIRGTAGYMAPEQVEGAASVAPPADVFALGAVLYECLAGRPAFPGESALELLARLSSGVTEPIGRRDVPPSLAEVVLRALARDPAARFPDGASLARALRSLREPSAVSKPAASKRPLAIPLAMGAGLGAIVLSVVALRQETRPAAPGPAVQGPPATSSGSPGLSARELFELGMEKDRAADWEGEIAVLARAIELDPGMARAWVNRGAARGQAHDWEGEIADETRAIELDPGSARVWTERGQARGQKGDWDRMIADSTRAIELAPADAVSWQNRGVARGQNGDIDGAIADFTKAIEVARELANPWANRGIARSHKGELDGAIADIERFLELAPADVNAPALRQALAELETKRAR